MTAQKIRSVQYLNDILSMADYEFLLKKAALQKEWLVYTYARMAGTTGMRLSEMLQIKREHLEAGHVDIYGKGAKRRRIYFPKAMRSDLLKLLDYLGLTSGFVFSPKFSGGKPYGNDGSFIQKKCELSEKKSVNFPKDYATRTGSGTFSRKNLSAKIKTYHFWLTCWVIAMLMSHGFI